MAGADLARVRLTRYRARPDGKIYFEQPALSSPHEANVAKLFSSSDLTVHRYEGHSALSANPTECKDKAAELLAPLTEDEVPTIPLHRIELQNAHPED